MILKKIIDRPKDVVGLHEIPSSKTILVCADGIVKGLVSKVYQSTPCKYKYRIQWANGHFTDLMVLSDLVSRYQADGYTFMVEIVPGEPLIAITTEPETITITEKKLMNTKQNESFYDTLLVLIEGEITDYKNNEIRVIEALDKITAICSLVSLVGEK